MNFFLFASLENYFYVSFLQRKFSMGILGMLDRVYLDKLNLDDLDEPILTLGIFG